MAAINRESFVLDPPDEPPDHDVMRGGAWPRYLAQYDDSRLPAGWVAAYDQIALPMEAGGHDMRAWAKHAHAAFVGQWSLTVQSAACADGLHYPILAEVLRQARAEAGLHPLFCFVCGMRASQKNSCVCQQRR